jgi:carbon storage regulator
MLVLSRRERQSIQIGPDVRVTIVRLQDGQVRIGIEAPSQVQVVRTELLKRCQKLGFEPPQAP